MKIRFRRILITLGIIFLLLQWKSIRAALSIFDAERWCREAFRPLMNSPPLGKFIVTILFIVLVFAVIYRLMKK